MMKHVFLRIDVKIRNSSSEIIAPQVPHMFRMYPLQEQSSSLAIIHKLNIIVSLLY